MDYVLYSPRGQGWFTRASTYSSDITEAKKFSRDDAIRFCKKHRTAAGHNMIPVRQEDIDALG
jgi:hypothetical protein